MLREQSHQDKNNAILRILTLLAAGVVSNHAETMMAGRSRRQGACPSQSLDQVLALSVFLIGYNSTSLTYQGAEFKATSLSKLIQEHATVREGRVISNNSCLELQTSSKLAMELDLETQADHS